MVRDELFERAKEMAAEWNIDTGTSRLTAYQQHGVNVPANTPKQYWRRALYLPLVNHLIQELNERLMKQHDQFLRQYLIPTKVNLLNSDTTDKIFCTYANDLTERVIFDGEIERWKSKRKQLPSENPTTLQDTLCQSGIRSCIPMSLLVSQRFWQCQCQQQPWNHHSVACKESKRTCTLLASREALWARISTRVQWHKHWHRQGGPGVLHQETPQFGIWILNTCTQTFLWPYILECHSNTCSFVFALIILYRSTEIQHLRELIVT